MGSHRFEQRQYWHVRFLEAGLERELPRKLTFTTQGKILELARRGEAWGRWRIGRLWNVP
ncbi:MAG: hypothetical protein QOJ51_6627 [Acidobacteriaceae bacterium]|jgi:hypothetical protein|nr:hypothetical protein [Acidobacteriaceae bacterium]